MSLADSLCRDPGTLVRRNKNQLCDYMTTEPLQLAGIPGGNFPSSHACRAARRMNQETGQRVTHCSCALLPRLMWSGPYWELYCHAVCMWKLWNLPLSWFVYERIRLRILKIERGLHVKMLDSAVFTVRPQLVYEVILLSKILRNRLLSKKKQCNYASFNVTLNYLVHGTMEFCVASSLVLDNWNNFSNSWQ